MNVLVVEDSRTQAEHLRQMLERAGVRAIVALDGHTAFKLAKEAVAGRPADANAASVATDTDESTADGHIDLVLSDVVMPRMNGYELTRRLRADEVTRELPIVLMTSLNDPEDVVRALAAGADNFVNKPYVERELVDRLRRTLAAKRGPSPSSLEVAVRGETLVVSRSPPTILAVLISALEDAATRNAELEASRRQLAEVTRERENLLSIVAHELRTPLNVLAMRAALDGRDFEASDERPRSDSPSRGSTESLPDLVGRQVGKMVAILDDLLDTARIDSGNLKMNPVPSDLVALAKDAVEGARLAATHEVSLVVLGTPPVVVVDPQRIGQVLNNFLSNAMKYSPAGTPVKLVVGASEGGARVAVHDRGIGVRLADRVHVFDRYFRSEEGRKVGQGLGLGLAICRQLVELHGGTIGVTSASDDDGTGSIFWFEVPLVCRPLDVPR